MLFISVCFFASAFAIPPAAETGLANQNQALQEANVDLMHQIEQKVGASNLETAIGSSWDHYIDWVIGQSGNVADKVAMFGLNGAAYTSETHANAMKLSQEERMAIANAFKTQDLGGLQNGFFVEGIRYLLLRSDPQMVIYGKLRGRGGITAHRTKSAIIIGHYPEGKNPKQMNYAIAACAETLEGWGYQETYSGAYSVLGQGKGVVVASFAFIGAISLIWHASRAFHKAYVSSEFTPIHEAEL